MSTKSSIESKSSGGSGGGKEKSGGESEESKKSERDDVTAAAKATPAEAEAGVAEAGGMTAEKSASTAGTQLSDKSVRGRLRRLFANEPEGMPLIGAVMHRAQSEGVKEDVGKGRQKKLGIMLGVYLPSIQNVFGVVMFLRLCWMVGMMGVWQAFLMVFLCCLVTFLTTLSVSAIATNGVVESGGTYFMISRSLGPHLGVACGILFYLANAIAVAMYIVGGVEIFLNYMSPKSYLFGAGDGSPDDYYALRSDMASLGSTYNHHVRIYGLIFLAVLFAIVAMGVRVVQLFAPFALAGVLVAILAIYVGAIEKAVTVSRPRVCLAEPPPLRLLYSKKCKGNSSEDPIYSCCPCDECPARNFGLYDNNGTCPPLLVQSQDDIDTGRCPRTRCVDGITGFSMKTFKKNSFPKYVTLDNPKGTPEDDAKVSIYEEKENGEAEQFTGMRKADAKEWGFVFNTETTTFFTVMGIYFPSVTGILTGSNMSGDLRDPQRSIPLGTLAAQLTTTFVYLSFVLIFGWCVEPTVLLDKNGDSIGNRMSIGELAWPSHWVVTVGCFLSTFGAGLQSLCSAPRLLASIAKDNIIPGLAPLAKVNCWNEPFVALLVTTAIAFVTLMIAKLDIVAPLVAMFFLQLYAMVNLACAVMTLMGAPGWRPRFKGYHWSLSLAGFFLSYAIMFSTYWYFALATMSIGAIVALVVALLGREMEWGDGTQGLSFSFAHFFLSKLEGVKPHPKNWRPQFLVLYRPGPGDTPADLAPSFSFITQMKAGKGLLMVVGLLEGDPTQTAATGPDLETQIHAVMEAADIRGFAKAVFYRKGRIGTALSTLLQSVGLSGLRPNTIFSPWPANWRERGEDFSVFMDRIHRSTRLELSLLIVKGLDVWPGEGVEKSGTMDVWWIISDGGLLLLCAHLLRKDAVWRGTTLRLFLVMEEHTEDGGAAVQKEVETLLYKLRIPAEVAVLPPSKSTDAYKRRDFQGRDELMSSMSPEEREKVRKADPQMRLEGAAAAASAKDDDAGSNLDSYLAAHPVVVPAPSTTGDETGSYMEVGGGAEALFSKETCAMARELNHQIRDHSSNADLIIMNLPQPPRSFAAMNNYMLYMDILMHKLPSVVLVRGTGKEVITIYQ